jgi:pyridinium-3,5-bisthiocarboxylic acid mononucleotide nickel chelatase
MVSAVRIDQDSTFSGRLAGFDRPPPWALAAAATSVFQEIALRVAYFDCFSGISGYMVLGALVDLGVPLERIQAGIDSMGLVQVRLRSAVVKKSGFRAIKIDIDHPPEHAHRHLHHIEAMIDAGSEITPQARELAKRIFSLIGAAEAKMHNTTIQKVHFHEVGAIDSIADIVGAAIGFDSLGIDRFESSPVPTGCGSVKIAHGLVSIPAPATAELLCGVPIASSTIEKELTTPTGAAILKALVSRFGPLPSMRLEAVGYGAGTMDLPEQANVLRIAIGQCEEDATPRGAESIPSEFDQVAVLETNIDDSVPEDLAACAAHLLEAGALDVYQTPCVMKKGRSGVQLTVICAPTRTGVMEHILMSETTTIGVRRYTVSRRKLIRREVTLQTTYGALRAKVVQLAAGQQRMMVEYDDALDAATKWRISLGAVRQAAAVAWAAQAASLQPHQPPR